MKSNSSLTVFKLLQHLIQYPRRLNRPLTEQYYLFSQPPHLVLLLVEPLRLPTELGQRLALAITHVEDSLRRR